MNLINFYFGCQNGKYQEVTDTIFEDCQYDRTKSFVPNICFGKPCIRGHRIWVSLILDFLAGGESIEEILEAYPSIEREDILACIVYGAEMLKAAEIAISVPVIEWV